MIRPKTVFGKKPYFPDEQAVLSSALMDVHRAVIVIVPEGIFGVEVPFISDDRRRKLAHRYLCRAKEKLNKVML